MCMGAIRSDPRFSMRVQNREDRHAAEQTLKEVMQKLEEAWRLARALEQQAKEHEVISLDAHRARLRG
jgi:hypothetical protein